MAKKKLKKFLKGAAKAALIGGALYGGSKLLKNRKAKSIADMDDAGIGVTRTSNLGGTDHFPVKAPAPYPDAILRGGVGVKHSPRRKVWTGKQSGDLSSGMFYTPEYKKGGRVTGIAKRGFGRALMKGKK